MIVDAHQHFWDFTRFDYLWMTPDREVLRRNFLPEDLSPLLATAGVNVSVVVQAHKSLDEAFWLLRLAEASKFVTGVVAWVDLTSPSLSRDLDELRRHEKFKGVRHPIEDETDDAWMIRPAVLEGFAELERRDIPYDLLIWPRHLKYVPQLREHCPGLRLVVEHMAKPPIAEGTMNGWERELEAVARLPSVWCKLSGMVTLAHTSNWTAERFKPYVEYALGLFGCDRVMFGSDWPVCTLAGSYQQVVEILRGALATISGANADKIWGENACAFYNLDSALGDSGAK